jgi:hypothetical protein
MGFVYFIETEDHQHVKIGFSTDVKKRFAGLHTSRPDSLHCIGWMPGSRQTEANFHITLASHRGQGEWFHDSPELRAFIAALPLETLDSFTSPHSATASRGRKGWRSRAPRAVKKVASPLTPVGLPLRIITAEGKRVLLARATATEIREHIKVLNRKHRARIAGLKDVLKVMEKYTPVRRGLTSADVAEMDAEASLQFSSI